MPDMSAIENTPEISFIDNKTVEDVRGEMVADYEDYMTPVSYTHLESKSASVLFLFIFVSPFLLIITTLFRTLTQP